MLRQLGDSNLEPGLNLLHDFLIGVRGNEGNGKTLGTEATSTAKRVMSRRATSQVIMHLPNTVEVAVGVGRAVIVDDNVDAFDIDATTKDISRDQDALLKGFEGCVPLDTVERLNEFFKKKKIAYRSSCWSPE
jgi:hypothetical protein